MSQYMKVETHLLQTPFCFLRNKDESEPENRSLISYKAEATGKLRLAAFRTNLGQHGGTHFTVGISDNLRAEGSGALQPTNAQNAYNLQQSCSTTDHLAPRTTSTSPPPQT